MTRYRDVHLSPDFTSQEVGMEPKEHVLGVFDVLCCTQEDSHSATASAHAVVQEQTATDRVVCSSPGLLCTFILSDQTAAS